LGGCEGARFEKSLKVQCAHRVSDSAFIRPVLQGSASIGSRRPVRRAAFVASLYRLHTWVLSAGSPSHFRLSSGWTTRWRLSATGALRDEEEEEICTVPFEGCTCGRKGPGSRCSRRSRPRS
jgi:hypothetical protein